MTVEVPAVGRRPPPWRDVRVLRVLFQLAVLGAVAGLGIWLVGNLTTNLRRQGLSTDFDYLRQSAGFRIADADFRASQPVWRALIVGIRNTATVALIGIVLATILGVLIGVARLSKNWLVARAASLYVEGLRNIPVLIIIFFMYTAVVLKLPGIQRAHEWFDAIVLSNSGLVVPSLTSVDDGTGALVVAMVAGVVLAATLAVWRTRRFDRTGEPHHRVLWGLGSLLGVAVIAFLATGMPVGLSVPTREGLVVTGGIRLPPEFAALGAGLVLYTASHIAEVVRGSIQAVSRGQSEAATALGLSEFQRYRFVVLPQALRIMIPPLANQFLNLTKNSSLAVFVAYPEITRITQIIISQRSPAPQSIAVLMAIYLAFSLLISLVSNLVNRRLQLVTR